jgi:hypothetical protein
MQAELIPPSSVSLWKSSLPLDIFCVGDSFLQVHLTTTLWIFVGQIWLCFSLASIRGSLKALRVRGSLSPWNREWDWS